jgi:hypothetical protein
MSKAALERARRAEEAAAVWLQPPYEPLETSELDRAFPALYERLMVQDEKIPDRYWSGRRTGLEEDPPYEGLTSAWMFGRLPADVSFAPREGVDAEKAYYHLACIIGSYGPKHEHKVACVAFLAELWFIGIGVMGRKALFGEDLIGEDADAE